MAILVILKSDLANSDPLQRMVVIGSDTCQMLVLDTFSCAPLKNAGFRDL